MTIQFRKVNLPPLPEINAKALIELAGSNSNLQAPSSPTGVASSKTIHRANLTEIIQDIEHSREDNITILEWIYCLHHKEDWDRQNPDRSKTTSTAIWKLAEQNEWLKQNLFWNLALSHYKIGSLAPSLVQTFDCFFSPNHLDIEKVEIIGIISSLEPAPELTAFCALKLITPQQLFYQYQLPAKQSIIDAASACVVNEFISTHEPNQNHVGWLLNCLQAMKMAQVKAVEQLLIEVDPKVGAKHTVLIDWLRQHYGSAVPNSRWHELSTEAKAGMRKWLGAVSYQDFQKLANLVLDRVHLEKHEHRRLRSRSGFWSNYSDRFERIRILLPQSSVNILGSYLNHQDVSILIEDGSETTEVCIFDFGDWFVVEFFRGNGSETRILSNNSETERQLFTSKLSIKHLRYLSLHHPVHDHVMCWQYFCVQWLKKRNILPNIGTQRFDGLPYQYSKYNAQTGLPKPSSENMRKRDRSLEYWRQDIARLEREARLYCSNR